MFDKGQIAFKDAALKADFRAVIDPLGKPLPFSEVTGKQSGGKAATPDYVFGWQVKGKYNGEPLSGSGKIGGMLSLQSADLPFPLQADVRSGSTRVAVAGTLSDPLNLGGPDVQLKFSGESTGDLYGLTGVLLPNTPPYATDGHLIARLHQPGGAVFEYQKFDGKIGDSDIHGDLKYVAGKPRPTLNGAVNSRQLRLADLAPLIGADSNAAKAGRGEKSRQPADKVLPVAQFDTQSWRKMDADVKFAAARIERGSDLPLSDLATHLKLNNGELRLDPLRFGMAGGSLNAVVRLDGGKSRCAAGGYACAQTPAQTAVAERSGDEAQPRADERRRRADGQRQFGGRAAGDQQRRPAPVDQ